MKLIITNIYSWMIKNFDLISIIIATCLTWISRFDFSKSVNVIVRDQLSPESFFSANSFVIDYPNGSLSAAINAFPNHNILLLYTYSHWDSESILHRSTIEKVAEATKYKIPIISLNCWDNNSNCYDILRPNRFPQLYAYISNSYFIEYKRSLDPIEIFEFVSSLFYPFHFPKSISDLENLIKSTDVSFIICLNSKSNLFSKRIKMFHKLSSAYKGQNKHRPNIAFIILSETDKTFNEFRLSLNLTNQEAILFNYLGVQEKYHGKLRVSEMLPFLKSDFLKLIINKFSPSGIKSLNIQHLLKRGFVVFYIYDESQKFSWNNVKSRYYFELLATQMATCSNINNSTVLDLFNFHKEQTINKYLNDYKNNLTCQLYFQSQVYSNFSLNIMEYIKLLNLNRSNHFTDYQQDPFIAHSLLLDVNWFCRKYLLMNDYQPDDVSKLSENIKNLLINSTESSSLPNGFKNFNRTITFAEMDGNKYSYFLDKWGLASTDIVQPQIVVIDWKNEMIHKMQSEISQISLNDLIEQVVINNLSSLIKSNHYPFNNISILPNFYPIDVITLEKELNDPETDLIVFYYTPWCSYCSSIMHLLMMLGRYFKNYPKLHFTSLDTFNNDLPYKYQSERIPALVMFPRGKKSDSYVFQITDKSVSLSNLVRFVLENSGDVNLNLNSPSVNYNNEYNVTCTKLCLHSAQQSITHLFQTMLRAYKNLNKKSMEYKSKIDKICSYQQLNWFVLNVANAKDWYEYKIKIYYIKYQAQLISDFNRILRKKHYLRGKVMKLAKLHKGIINLQERKIINKSVQSLANDILNFST